MMNNFYLDKQKLIVLLSVLFLLSSFIWVGATAQESTELGENVISEEVVLNEIDVQEINNSEDEVVDDAESISDVEDLSNIESNLTYSSNLTEVLVSESDDLVPYVIFNQDGEKEIETLIEEDREISIVKEESVTLSSSDEWEKEVTVYSDEHFERSLIVYSDIKEGEFTNIELYWLNNRIDVTNDPSFEFTLYDTDLNGLDDKVSFKVPHLSEQNFEIRISYNLYSTASNNMTLDVYGAPSSMITTSRMLNFNFSVGYSNITSVFCDLKISLGSNVAYHQNGFVSNPFNVNSSSLTNGNYSWDLLCKDYYFPSINDTESGGFQIAVNYTPSISFTYSASTINVGQTVNFYVNLTTIDNRSMIYNLFFGEGTPIGPSLTNNINQIFPHTFNTRGNYTASLIVIDGSSTYSYTLPIAVLNSTSSNSTSSQNNAGNLDVVLSYPSNDAVLTTDSVNFSYYARSNVSITNCSFSLYYFNGTGIGVLVYSEVNSSIRNNATDMISLTSFDEGDYSWEVECTDSERKYDSSDRDFSFDSPSNITQLGISTLNSSYERKEDIESILANIDSFLEEMDKYGFEEKEIIEIMGISEDLVSYKRKLNQFKQDLKHNINFIQSENERDKRKNEIFKEIDEIKDKVPLSLEVVKSEEYVKNSIDSNLEEVVSNYVQSENLVLSNREKRKLSDYIESLQNSIKVSVKASQVSIEYEDKSSELTFLVKSIVLDSTKEHRILEIIPKDVADGAGLNILNDYNSIENNTLFAVDISQLIDEKIIYYFESFVSLEKVKDIDTILFSETYEQKSGFLTGFAILDDSDGLSSFAIYVSWALFIAFFLIGSLLFVKRAVTARYSSNDDVKAILAIISESQRSLISKDIVRAKSNYEKIKEIYGFLPSESKVVVYGDIQKFLLKIDRIEVSDLIQECIDSIREGRKDDALMIYEKIQSFYSRMPKKYKQKIHEKITPYMYFFNKYR